MKRPCAFVLAGMCLAAGAPSRADTGQEESLFGEIPMVFAVSKKLQPANLSPSNVTIISREMIERYGMRDFTDLMKYVTGLWGHPSRTMTDFYAVRGGFQAEKSKIAFAVNGFSITPTGFSTVLLDWLPVSLDNVAHVEIIKGPVSTTYGSEAFLGVVNFVTKKGAADDTGVTQKASYGTYDSLRSYTSYGFDDGDLDFHTSFSYVDRAGSPQTLGADGEVIKPSFDPVQNRALNPGRKNILDSWYTHTTAKYKEKVTLQAGAGDLKQVGPSDVGAAGDPFRKEFHYLEMGYNHKPASYSHTTKFSVFRNKSAHDFTFNSDGRSLVRRSPVLPGSDYRYEGVDEQRYQVETILGLTGLLQERLDLNMGVSGAAYRYGEVPSLVVDESTGVTARRPKAGRPFITTDSQLYGFLLADLTLVPDRLIFSSGGRAQTTKRSGGSLTPRLALIYSSPHELVVKAMYNTGFKNPTYWHRYHPHNTFDDQDNEDIRAYELEISKNWQKWKAKLNLYQQTAKNQLLFYLDGFLSLPPGTPWGSWDGVNRIGFGNGGGYTVKGLEFELRGSMADNKMHPFLLFEIQGKRSGSLQGNESGYIDGQNLFITPATSVMPQYAFKLGLDRDFLEKWNVAALGRHENWVQVRGEPSARPQDLYGENHIFLDLHLTGRRVLPGLDVGLHVENVTNHVRRSSLNPDQYLAKNFASPPREIEATLTYHF